MNIQAWWEQLAEREKNIFLLGSVVGVLLLGYLLVFSPLKNSVDTLKSHVVDNQALLHWMEKADQAIQKSGTSEKVTKLTDSQALLSVVQRTLKQTFFSDQLTQMKQVSNETVELQFKEVSFDALTEWLITLWFSHGIKVVSADIQSVEKQPGIVQASLVLSS